MAILILVPLILAIVGLAVVLGTLNAYQAVTGTRLSAAPSKRTDRQVRAQSAVSAVVLLVAAVVLLGFLLLALILML